MATGQEQDVIRCDLCENPVVFHCNPCITNMCGNCVLTHMSDKTKKHEVVEFKNKKENFLYPECKSHESKCETYCHGCKVPVCIKCAISLHKEHDVTEIEEIVQKHREIIKSDTQKLRGKVEDFQTRKEKISRSEEAFDKVIADITRMEKEIQELAHNVAEKMRKEVAEKKDENEAVNAGNESKVSDAERKVQRAIENNIELLQSKNIMDFINYRGAYEDVTKYLNLAENLYPLMLCSEIREHQILHLFGTLSFEEDQKVRREVFHLIENPKVLATVQSDHSKLRQIFCAGNERVWTSGNKNTITQIEKYGDNSINIKSNGSPTCLSIDHQGCLVFSTTDDTKIRVYKEGHVETLLNITSWRPRGICHTRNGDMLVSLRSKGKKQSKVVRYSDTTETQSIQYDKKGQPLFSTGSQSALFQTENGNGDVCVADYGGKEVVVVNAFGGLRFKYRGNLSKQSKYTEFKPLFIAANVYHQVLINDNINNIVHVVNSDGNFIRYIEHPCNGGLSIDADHNLVVGDETSGEIKIMKYLQ
ncbi:uncharacterized protein LOC125662206 [Ostrea edulis]|uniref:uncharacterized protein LOC125662206 n=1 Tax=Ostrea edulis TaxID=37623 RepID=UPI0024AF2447|nr:uncharacterized protein LOC125662206 [Ostrea edulis]